MHPNHFWNLRTIGGQYLYFKLSDSKFYRHETFSLSCLGISGSGTLPLGRFSVDRSGRFSWRRNWSDRSRLGWEEDLIIEIHKIQYFVTFSLVRANKERADKIRVLFHPFFCGFNSESWKIFQRTKNFSGEKRQPEIRLRSQANIGSITLFVLAEETLVNGYMLKFSLDS